MGLPGWYFPDYEIGCDIQVDAGFVRSRRLYAILDRLTNSQMAIINAV
jgi:hypothetical protein